MMFRLRCSVLDKVKPSIGVRFYGQIGHDGGGKSSFSTNHQPADDIDPNRLRNIGIVAHINAGKTTTTERFLFNAGSTQTVGDVDKGNTVTDYLEQERDRGITITSAAVTYNWRKHRVNLIDTPGHVDFTYEVERSLSVLDGVVTLLDASAGVEAQTISVWNQAKKYNLPNVIFLNKCDKPQADIEMCMKDLKNDLSIRANLIQLPVKQSGKLTSIVDLIERKLITWTTPERCYGSKYTTELLEAISGDLVDKKQLDKIEEEREKLVNNLCDYDETLANHVIECDKLSQVRSEFIVKALRQATIKCQLSPVLIGSTFKYVGVQQLMDAIVYYLPSPIERRFQLFGGDNCNTCNLIEQMQIRAQDNDSSTCAFIFKIAHDKRLGALSYMRIYNGTLSKLTRLQNLETDKLEQVKKIYRVFADELSEIETPVGRDDIVVATGLTESRTGDILHSQNIRKLKLRPDIEDELALDQTNNLKEKDENKEESLPLLMPFQRLTKSIFVPRIARLEPVYFCSIEARKISHQLKLEHALACLSREDPSFTYEINLQGITTIRGMGKLHLEIARDRIQTEHGVDSILGRLQISYRETIDGFATQELTVNRLVNSVNNSLTIKLYVRSLPKAGSWTGKRLRIDTHGETSLVRLRSDQRKAIVNGFMSALQHGPSMGYQVIDCDILLLDFKANNRCGLPVIASAASQCLANALSRCSPILLEPIMLLEVVTPKAHNGSIVSDILSNRRGLVLSTQARENGTIVIRSHTPLASLSDYSEFLRITTSGRASFSIKLQTYSAMSEADKQNVVRL